MPTNANTGAYYKKRTKAWLIAKGFQVADLELVRTVYVPGRAPFPTKRDQFGADLLAMAHDRIVFVQVKGGKQCEGKGQFLPAHREFNLHKFPRFVTRAIVAWAPGARQPRTIIVPHPEVEHGQENSAGTEEKGTPQRVEETRQVRKGKKPERSRRATRNAVQ